MAKRQLVKGSASVILEIFIQDSSSLTGAGLTGLVFNSSGLTCYYHRNTAASAVAVSLVTMTVGTFTSSGFVAVDGTNMPGVYQLCIPDAALVTGATSVSVLLKGATNMAPLTLELELTAVDNQDGVRFGMTALPNAAAAASGGLPTIGVTIPNATAGAAGGLFIAGTNAATTITTALTTTFTGNLTGSVGSVTGAVGSVTGAVGSVTGNVGGNVVGTVASVVGNVAGNVTGSIGSLATQAKTDVGNAVATRQVGGTVAADGSKPTIEQALYLIQQMLGEFGYSGTALSVKDVDGTTVLASFTLDSATTPTSLVRTA